MAGSLENVTRAARAGIAFAVFWLVSQGIGSAFAGDPLEWAYWLRTAVILVAAFTVGGAIYSLTLPLFGSARKDQLTARVLAGLIAGAITMAPLALLYLRRDPAPGDLSHAGFATLALLSGAVGGGLVTLLATAGNRRGSATRAGDG